MDVQAEKKKAYFEEEKTKSRTLGKFIEQHYAPWVKVERKRGSETIKRLNAHFSERMKLSLSEEAIQNLILQSSTIHSDKMM